MPGENTRLLAKKTLDILRRPSRRAKFIWVHILDPHFPYQPLPEVLERLKQRQAVLADLQHQIRQDIQVVELALNGRP